MKICGIQKTSLVDWPGQMATVIFTGGCNFNCPYCHNSQLIGNDVEAEYTVGETLDILERRYHLVDAVVISGGEPTLQPDLHAFISKLKSMGFKVKLDTNGSNPDVLNKLLADNLLDYVAMDIKSSRSKYLGYYGLVNATDIINLDHNIDMSIRMLLNSDISYEFRTTVVKGLHTIRDIESVGKRIRGAKHYYIQNYKESENVPYKDLLCSFEEHNLREFASIVRPYVKNVHVRGV